MKKSIAGFVMLVVLGAANTEATPILASQVATTSGFQNSQTSAVGPMTTALSPIPQLVGQTVADYGKVHSFTSVTGVDAGGNMSAYALWDDLFTITGPTAGASVDFMVDFAMTGTMSLPDDRALANNPSRFGYQVGSANAWLQGLPGATGPCFTGSIGVGGGGVPVCNASAEKTAEKRYYLGDQIYDVEHENGTFASSFLVSLIIGQSYDIRETVSTSNYIFDLPFSTISSDFTATFFLTPVGSGYGYTTASGRDYAAAPTAPADPVGVPEPGSLTLLGIGGLCSLARLRRQAR